MRRAFIPATGPRPFPACAKALKKSAMRKRRRRSRVLRRHCRIMQRPLIQPQPIWKKRDIKKIIFTAETRRRGENATHVNHFTTEHGDTEKTGTHEGSGALLQIRVYPR